MYPRGWFVVAQREEVVAERELDVRYFDTPLRIRRDARGKACADGWITRERNGLVFVSYPAGTTPDYEIPDIEESADESWEPWVMKRMDIATQSREIIENVADRGHFLPVHGTRFDTFENEFTGHLAIQRTTGRGSDDYPDSPFETEAIYYGPSFQVTRLFSRGVWALLINTHTMIDERRLHLWFGVKVQRTKHSARFVDHYIHDIRNGFLQDVRIWEHKKWRDTPILCDGDGPIMKLRKWYAQFYDRA